MNKQNEEKKKRDKERTKRRKRERAISKERESVKNILTNFTPEMNY